MTAPARAIFLSYASQDAPAAECLAAELRDAGLEVWFDRNELRGGDAWDASIRQQIKSCALLVPVISANTQARSEGYFRREWKLAVDRMSDMAEDHPFLLPVVIDDTAEGAARVPDAFRERQWSRLKDGAPSAEFIERVRRLLDPPALPPAAATGTPRRESRPARKTARSRFALVAGIAALVGLGGASWVATRYLKGSSSIAPYSVEDRRMTFAVLPFRAPPGDKSAAEVAATVAEATYASQEKRSLWVRVASPRSVETAVARHAAAKDVAAELNVHFLIRGNVMPAKDGHDVELAVVDGATERVLGTKRLAAASNGLTEGKREDLNDALGSLTYSGLISETEQAKGKPPDALDVRDLTFRAYVDWNERKEKKDEKGAYASASALLNRALALEPEDPLALWVTARVNLCDCINGWSRNVAEQQAIGEAALEKYLRKDPDSVTMLVTKADLYALRGRHEESLLILEAALQRNPGRTFGRGLRAYNLLKLGRAKDAWAVLNPLLETDRNGSTLAMAAAAQYSLEQYAAAAQLAQEAKTHLDRDDLSNTRFGTVALTLVAAEGRLGRLARAKQAMADFNASVPGVETIAAVRKWMHPMADLAGYEPLFDGLRLAGIRD